MNGLLIYLLKTMVCLIVFYLFYKAFLSNETFFRFNRCILLLGTGLCFMLPTVKIKIAEATVVQMPLMILEESLHVRDAASSVDTWTDHTAATSNEISRSEMSSDRKPISIELTTILLLLFLVGVTVNLFILFKSFFSMFNLIRHSRKIDGLACKVLLSEKISSPFSWYKYIVVSTYDFENHTDEIMSHEAAHIRHKHTFDVILFEFFVLIQWFNPAIWLLKRELKDIHEYQADLSVLHSGIDATKYQLLLVKKAVGAKSYSFANSLNQSKIKKRITMMLKEKSKNCAKWKLLILLPALSVMLAAFAKPENLSVTGQITSDKSTKKTDYPEKYSKEYFEKEYDMFIEQLSAGKELSEVERAELIRKGYSALDINVLSIDNDVSKIDSIIRNTLEGMINIIIPEPENKDRPFLFRIHYCYYANDNDFLSKDVDEDKIWEMVQDILSEKDDSDFLSKKVIVTIHAEKAKLDKESKLTEANTPKVMTLISTQREDFKRRPK